MWSGSFALKLNFGCNFGCATLDGNIVGVTVCIHSKRVLAVHVILGLTTPRNYRKIIDSNLLLSAVSTLCTLMKCTQMSSQGGQQGEVLHTDRTVEGLRIRMDNLVSLEVSFPGESLSTHQALERPLSGVNPHVFGQMLNTGKPLPALRALKRPRSGRNTLRVVVCGDIWKGKRLLCCLSQQIHTSIQYIWRVNNKSVSDYIL